MDKLEKSTLLIKRFVRSESVVHRQIAGESILVPIHKRVEEADAIFTLNEVASRFWELLNEDRTFDEISKQLLKERIWAIKLASLI